MPSTYVIRPFASTLLPDQSAQRLSVKVYTYGATVLHDAVNYYLQEKPYSVVPRIQSLHKVGRLDGMMLSGQAIDQRTIVVKIKVVANDRTDLESKLSTLHQGLALRQQPLTIYATDNRSFIADATVTDETLVGGQPNAVLVQVTFTCQQPYAYAPATSLYDTGTLLLTGAGTTWNAPLQTITGGGNTSARPTIRIYQRVTNLTWTSIQIQQQTRGQTIKITTGMPTVAGDYVDFFCDAVQSANGSTIQKNSSGSALDFTGAFPVMEYGGTVWGITVTAPSAPQAEVVWTWTPRWLP